MSDEPANEDSSDATPRSIFWTSMAIGGAITAFGVIQLVRTIGSGLGSFIPWFAGGAILLDLAIVPIGAGIGHFGRKLLPAWTWPPVRAGLMITAVLVAFAVPLIQKLDNSPNNPTVQPRHYGSGLLAALVVTWVATAIAVGVVALVGTRPTDEVAPTG